MYKKIILGFLCAALTALLLVLYLLSSTDLILSEHSDKIYKISILISDTNDMAWQSFRKGADYAAKKYNVDLQFKTLYNWRDVGEQQSNMLEADMKTGTECAVVFATDTEKIGNIIKEKKLYNQIIVAGTTIQNEKITSGVLYDYVKMGNDLAEKIQKDTDGKYYEIAIAGDNADRESDRLFISGIQEILGERVQLQNLVISNQEQAYTLLQEYVGKNKNVAVVAMQPQTAEFLAQAREILPKEIDINIYSHGYTNEVLHHLENGGIQAIVCNNYYNAGYLVVKNATIKIDNKNASSIRTIDYKVITTENMFEPENEFFIFPQ